jgi:hypothetical protein
MAELLKEQHDREFGAPALKRHKRRRSNAHNRRQQFKRPRVVEFKQDQAVNVPPRAGCTTPDLPPKAQQPGKSTMVQAEKETSSEIEHGTNAATRYSLGTNRRMRRDKPELLQHHSSLKATPESAAPHSLPTHAFLCKRFVMEHRAGWKIPVHACGKGHRKHSLKHAMLSAAVLEERSHWPTFVMSGPAEEVASILLDLIAPETCLWGSEMIKINATSGSAMDDVPDLQHGSTLALQHEDMPQQQAASAGAKVLSHIQDFQGYVMSCCNSPGSFLLRACIVDNKRPAQSSCIISPCLLDISHPDSSLHGAKPVGSLSEMHDDAHNQLEGCNDAHACSVAHANATARLSVHPAAETAVQELSSRLQGGKESKVTLVKECEDHPPQAVWLLKGLCVQQVAQRAFAVAALQQALDAEQHQNSVLHALVRCHALSSQQTVVMVLVCLCSLGFALVLSGRCPYFCLR